MKDRINIDGEQYGKLDVQHFKTELEEIREAGFSASSTIEGYRDMQRLINKKLKSIK